MTGVVIVNPDPPGAEPGISRPPAPTLAQGRDGLFRQRLGEYLPFTRIDIVLYTSQSPPFHPAHLTNPPEDSMICRTITLGRQL